VLFLESMIPEIIRYSLSEKFEKYMLVKKTYGKWIICVLEIFNVFHKLTVTGWY
jgi:hypothetical protein